MKRIFTNFLSCLLFFNSISNEVYAASKLRDIFVGAVSGFFSSCCSIDDQYAKELRENIKLMSEIRNSCGENDKGMISEAIKRDTVKLRKRTEMSFLQRISSDLRDNCCCNCCHSECCSKCCSGYCPVYCSECCPKKHGNMLYSSQYDDIREGYRFSDGFI